MPFENRKTEKPKNRKKGCKDAQFILGYKGMIQLALRSWQYKRLNVLAVKEGELLSWNPLTEEFDLRLIENDTEREQTTAGRGSERG